VSTPHDAPATKRKCLHNNVEEEQPTPERHRPKRGGLVHTNRGDAQDGWRAQSHTPQIHTSHKGLMTK
jgi:hypothetical protein